MSNLLLTDVGKIQIAAKQAAGQPLLLRKITFSPDLSVPDPTWTALPLEISTKYDLSHVGKLPDEDAVLYSATLDQSVGDFTISLIAYYDDDGILILVDQIPPFDKKSDTGGGLANVFRHNAVINFDNAPAAMPINVPTAQFHPEPIEMMRVRSEMGVVLDTAITSSETFLTEVPRIDARIERLEGRSVVIADAVEAALTEVQGNQARLDQLESDSQTHTDDLNQQVKGIVADGLVLYGPLVNFDGSGLVVDQNTQTITFSVPEEQQGVEIRLAGDSDFTRFKRLSLVSDEFILLEQGTEEIKLQLNPDRLKAFGTFQVADENELTTLNADGLDTTVTLAAGRGINLSADDTNNTLTVSTDDLQGFQRLVVSDEQQTTTLSSEDSATLRINNGENIRLTTNAETNSVTINSNSFGELLVRAENPQNDASLSASEQKVLAFEESETVRISLVGYGTNSQAVKFETSFPDVINESFEIKGGNLRVAQDENKVGGHFYCEELFCSGEITGFSTVSDERLKKNLMPLEGALEKVAKLNGYRFEWKPEMPQYGGKPDIGLLAQEVQEVIPEAVYETEWVADDGLIKTIRYERIVPVLVEAIKTLQDRVNELEKKINRESE